MEKIVSESKEGFICEVVVPKPFNPSPERGSGGETGNQRRQAATTVGQTKQKVVESLIDEGEICYSKGFQKAESKLCGSVFAKRSPRTNNPFAIVRQNS